MGTVVVLFIATLVAEFGRAAGGNSAATDAANLLSFRSSWNNAKEDILSATADWVGDNPCIWSGLSCTNGRVTGLDFTSIITVKGPTNGAIAALDQLATVAYNSYNTADPFPTWLTKITTLESLSGSIAAPMPQDIGNLVNLKTLKISGLQGPFPASFNQLRSLETFDGGFSGITGTLPSAIGKLTRLRYIDISASELTGQLPAWLGQCHSLETLVLSSSHLQGPIPPSIGQLNNLTRLELFNNELSGPVSFGNLNKLTKIDLSSNKLTGFSLIGQSSLPALSTLDLANNLLTETIFPALSSCKSLARINLRLNRLAGNVAVLASVIQQLPKLENLIASNNLLTGIFHVSSPLSPSLALPGFNTGSILLDHNRIRGLSTDPQHLAVGQLDLSDNRLRGRITIPNKVTSLNVANNRLRAIDFLPAAAYANGRIYTWFLFNNKFRGAFDLPTPHVSLLSAAHNSFTSFTVSSPSALTILDLSHNRLSGPFPASLLQAPSLSYAVLSFNRLSGPLPADLGALNSLDISNNRFSGSYTGPTDNFGVVDFSENYFAAVPSVPFPSLFKTAGNCVGITTCVCAVPGQRNVTECSKVYPSLRCRCPVSPLPPHCPQLVKTTCPAAKS